MTSIWYTSDPHFGHPKVAELRGFDSVEEHDQAILNNWNSLVKPGNTVWLLGDVSMRFDTYVKDVVSQLNGDIQLVAGNHDDVHPMHKTAHKKQGEWLELFGSVQAFAKRKILGHDVLLSHFPYLGDHTEEARYVQYRLRDTGNFLLHGHTHSWRKFNDLSNLRQIHIGLDAWNLKPVPQREIERLIREVDAEYESHKEVECDQTGTSIS